MSVQRLIQIDSDAAHVIGAAADTEVFECLVFRQLAVGFHHTAGRAAAEQDGVGAFQHLDLGEVEGIAVVHADVAHAIQEHVGARIESGE